jgi:hypothetical protein
MRVARKPSRAARMRTHPCATTTPRLRRSIQESEEKNIVLAKRYRVNRKTIAKWKARDSTCDDGMGPKKPRSRLLLPEDEAIILAYRWRTRLALNDCHLRLRSLRPKLSRSTLYRCLERRGLGRIGSTAICPPLTTAALRGPYIFEITAHALSSVTLKPTLALSTRSFSPSKRSRETFMRRSQTIHLRTPQHYLLAWLTTFPKKLLR